jgi:hypothetical protein
METPAMVSDMEIIIEQLGDNTWGSELVGVTSFIFLSRWSTP